MYVSRMNVWRRACGSLFALLTIYVLSSSLGWAASASLSTDTVNVDAGQTGSWTISGNDSGNQHKFR